MYGLIILYYKNCYCYHYIDSYGVNNFQNAEKYHEIFNVSSEPSPSLENLAGLFTLD
jgi:hypothetical protein